MTAPDDDPEAWRKLALDSEPRVLTALAKRVLVGDGVRQNLQEAVGLLRRAAANGDGEAAAQLAVCAAWGVAQPRDFGQALTHLERAAALDWLPAQLELQLLARQSGSDWPALRLKIDAAAWTASPAVRIVSENPRIVVVEHFMSAAECDWLIQRGRPGLGPALVYRGSSQARAVDTRTNSEVAFGIFNADAMLSLIRERMSAAAGAPTSCFEITKLLHYEPGQQFALHADFIQPNTPELVKEVQVRGQRAATLLVYLNEGYEGGETDFPRIGFRFKGKRGDAMVFSNIDAAGAPDYASVHAGLPPLQGEKWLLSQWIRTRPVSA